MVEIGEILDRGFALDLDVVPLVVGAGASLRPSKLFGRPNCVRSAFATLGTRRNFLGAGTGNANVYDVELVIVDVSPCVHEVFGEDASQAIGLVRIVKQLVHLGNRC